MKIKIVFTLLIGCLLLGLVACTGKTTSSEQPTNKSSQPESTVTPVIDIKTIANKSQEEVATILGSPITSKETTLTLANGTKKDAISSTYQNQSNVLFVDGKAIWIIVYPPEGTVVNVENGAKLIGLNAEERGTASTNDNNDSVWSGGLYAIIQAYNDGNGAISHVDVITTTEGN